MSGRMQLMYFIIPFERLKRPQDQEKEKLKFHPPQDWSALADPWVETNSVSVY